MANGVSKMQEHKIRKVMREFKAGTLKSGGTGPRVSDPKQAIAIAYSEAKKAKRSKGPKEDTPLNTKMPMDTPAMRAKRKKQMGDSMM